MCPPTLTGNPPPPLGPTASYNPVTIYGLSLSGLALPAQALCPLLDARFRAKKKTPILGAFYTLSTGVKYHLIKTSRSFFVPRLIWIILRFLCKIVSFPIKFRILN